MTGAREHILQRLRAARPMPPEAVAYTPPPIGDPVSRFRSKAKASYAELQDVANAQDLPEAVFAIVAAAQAKPRLHLPKESPLRALPWHRVPQLALSEAPPASGDTALSVADHALAETGSLVFLSGPARPAAWHFLPGREIVVLPTERIAGTLEDLFASLGPLPSTLNLVTGPSRTGDIEQTMELGAHGPRALHILMVPFAL